LVAKFLLLRGAGCTMMTEGADAVIGKRRAMVFINLGGSRERLVPLEGAALVGRLKIPPRGNTPRYAKEEWVEWVCGQTEPLLLCTRA
jgi:hypothetical protein